MKREAGQQELSTQPYLILTVRLDDDCTSVVGLKKEPAPS